MKTQSNRPYSVYIISTCAGHRGWYRSRGRCLSWRVTRTDSAPFAPPTASSLASDAPAAPVSCYVTLHKHTHILSLSLSPQRSWRVPITAVRSVTVLTPRRSSGITTTYYPYPDLYNMHNVLYYSTKPDLLF